MANGTAAVDQLTTILAELRREHDLALNRLSDVKGEVEAIEGALRVLRARETRNAPGVLDPKRLRGKGQIEALRYIARKHKGELKVTYARRLLLQAGLIRTPKNASSIIYNVIRRSDLFDWVGRGTYRLKSFKGERAKVTAIRRSA